MPLFTDLIDQIVTKLRAAMESGGILEDVKALYVGNMDIATTLEHPYLWLFYGSPAIEERWAAAHRIKDATHHFVIEGGVNLDKNVADRVYGSATGSVKGPVDLAARTQDVLHAADLHTAGLRVKTFDASIEAIEAEHGKDVGGFIIRLDVVQHFGDRDRRV